MEWAVLPLVRGGGMNLEKLEPSFFEYSPEQGTKLKRVSGVRDKAGAPHMAHFAMCGFRHHWNVPGSPSHSNPGIYSDW